MKLGVALGWHAHPYEVLLELTREAERLGFSSVFVDGDVSMIPSLGDDDCLDGWTVTTALLAATERIQIGSIRLVHYWHAARLAQSLATLERLFPNRVRFLISLGGWDTDRRFGLPFPTPARRIAWLDETLTAVRALWRGEEVSLEGEYVHLEKARVRPLPGPGRIPIEIAGRGPRLLSLVARHADRWDLNLPPLSDWVAPAEATLSKACRSIGRDPADLQRSMWVFTRLTEDPAESPGLGTATIHAEYRRRCPWFAGVPDQRLSEAIVAGGEAYCRQRLEGIHQELGIDEPILDLSGLDALSTRRVMKTLSPGE